MSAVEQSTHGRPSTDAESLPDTVSALEVMATPKRHVNMLQHILGYFTDQLETHLLPFTTERPHDRGRLWRMCTRLGDLAPSSNDPRGAHA